jgi:hypothetical protein
MQEGQPEGVAEDNFTPTPQQIEKWELSFAVLKEAVASADIQDISEYKGEPFDKRWHVFSQERKNDVVLKLFIRGLFGWVNADVTLIPAATFIVDEIDALLSQPDAMRKFDFAEEERAEVLRENARIILTKYVSQIPLIAFQALSQGLNEAVQSHIKTYVEPRLREHWQSLGFPADFTISPSEEFTNHLKGIDEQFNAIRKGLGGDKRAWLTDEKRANLDEEHEQLRLQYQAAKEFYNQSRKAFFAGKRNRTEDDWTEEWTTQSYRMFPNLHYHCLDEIYNYQPFELAHMHLADSYEYSPEYIKKLVSQASRLKSKKPQ